MIVAHTVRAVAAMTALTALVLAPAVSVAGELPASVYDRPGVTHNSQCVGTRGGDAVVVRGVGGEQLRGASGPITEPPEQRETCVRAPGVRLEGIEWVPGALAPGDAGRMYYSWPLEGGAQASGFVAAYELASQPALDAADAAGNGEPAPPAPDEPVYAVSPQVIAFEQRYGGPSTARWYTYSVYGLPLAAARFALMTWSWIDVAGGGIARAAVAEGELFHPADVQPITLASAPGAGAAQNGTVTAAYGFVESAGERLYGWMVTSHTFAGVCFDHMAYAGGGSPVPGTLCPESSLRNAIVDGSALTG